MRPTTVRVVAALLAVLLVLGAAGLALSTLDLNDDSATPAGRDSEPESGSESVDGTPTVAPTPTPQVGATDPPSPALAAYYSQKLDWRSCRDTFECATLEVPVDYATPTGATIELALLKDAADDPSARVGSLVVNPGGPGGSGQDYAAAGPAAWGKALRSHFDIVGIDPRGVGESDPITCADAAGEDAFLAMDPDPDSSTEEQAYVQGVATFVAGCVTGSGDLAAHVSTIEAAMDMDVLRAALGETTLTYFGASYGTKLGATYAEWFPTRVGRFVLDGAVDPALDFRAAAASQAAGFQTALTAYVDDCVAQGDCVLGDSGSSGLARITEFLDDLDRQPLSTRDSTRDLTEGLGYYGIIAALYNKDYWTYLTQAFQGAFNGDGTIMLLLADAYAGRSPDGTYDGNLLQAFTAISCLDDPSFVPPDEVPAEIARLEQVAPSFARIFAWGMIACQSYTAGSDQVVRPLRAQGAAPIVVIGTTRDPATPYQQAVDLAEELDSGVLVSRDGDGHTAYQSGNECIDSAVEDYLAEAAVPKDGLSC